MELSDATNTSSLEPKPGSGEQVAEPTVANDGLPEPAQPVHDSNNGGLRVLFLSSDTGGGHRASAESLANQFQLLYPGSTYELLDLASESYLPPYNSIVSYYKHLSAHPAQWKVLYGVTNSKMMESVVDTNIKVMTLVCERSMRKKINQYAPDVVISVHPLMTSVPQLSCAKISHETGKHLPMFTVVTDLGSAHSTWFASGVERLFVGSKQIYELAKSRGKVPDEKLVLVGLPIRHDFAVQAEKLGDRMSPEGKKYQRHVRETLGLPVLDRKTLLLMGGGEGVGSLSNIVDSLYRELVKQGIDCLILVVCGRNEKLKQSLEERNWEEVLQSSNGNKEPKKRGGLIFTGRTGGDCGTSVPAATGCIEGGVVSKSLRKILSTGNIMYGQSHAFVMSPQSGDDGDNNDVNGDGGDENKQKEFFKSNSFGALNSGDLPTTDQKPDKSDEKTDAKESLDSVEAQKVVDAPVDSVISNAAGTAREPGQVAVVGLGFVTRMAEYMVAADVLISKAGPGTISEAAAVSLPVMLTSFLPGQEEGNVDFVIDGGFGDFCSDNDPDNIAEEVAHWLNDESKLEALSAAAKKIGNPYAAQEIARQIGESTLKWRELNENNATTAEEKKSSDSQS